MDFTDSTIMEENEEVIGTTTVDAESAESETADAPVEVIKEQIVYLPIGRLYPHPDNPRKELGDLTELADNIRQTKRILQNLMVVPWETDENGEMKYRIIAGHRRRAAAEIAGLAELPCVIVDLTPEEQLEVMMNENVHRSNLTVLEQAKGFQLMFDILGSVDAVSKRTGFSRSKVSNSIKYNQLDQSKLEKACSARQVSFTDLNRLNEVDDIDDRNGLLECIGTDNFSHRLRTVLNKQEAKKKKAIIKPLLRKMGFKSKKCERYYYHDDATANKNELDVEELTEEAIKQFIKDHGYPDGEQIYYCVFDNDGDTYLFNDAPEPTAAQKIKMAAEEAKKAKMQELTERFVELEKAAYQCRVEFISKCSATVIKKNLKAVALLLNYSHDKYTSFDRAAYKDLLGLVKPEDGEITHEMVAQAVEGSPEKALLYYAYSELRDSEKENYRGYNLSYDVNKTLEIIYDTLVALGYALSDDEKALRDGSHALFAEAAALTKPSDDSNDSSDSGETEDYDDDDYYDEEEDYDEYEEDYEEDEQVMDDFPFGGGNADEDEEDDEELLAS